MEEFLTLEQIDQVTEFILSKINQKPEVGMILGSGLGELADLVENADVIPTEEIPLWPVSTVMGHKGRLVIGVLEGQTVMFLQGRSHYYEGYNMSQLTLPVRVMLRMGFKALIVTNAAGAINPSFTPGDVMLITDHLGLIGMGGLNPLRGPNFEEFGVRFPDMSMAYDREFQDIARNAARNEGIRLQEGVYACLAGPSFETPAELRYLRIIGADAVGMSTVPEVTVAHHGKLRVLGMSGISNKANLDGSTITTHEEVLEAGQVIVPKLKAIVLRFLRNI
ncbi:MAG: purine-nucleoside phosphorylase [Anaerolineaceae bacterium]|nr:purine-nucleoside phosphorylase [Anaerolineaceae bacterium]